MGNKLIRFVDSSMKSILFLRRQFLSCFLDISSHQKEKSAQREGKRKQEIKGHSPERNTRHKEKEQESGLNSNAIGQKTRQMEETDVLLFRLRDYKRQQRRCHTTNSVRNGSAQRGCGASGPFVPLSTKSGLWRTKPRQKGKIGLSFLGHSKWEQTNK